jgi:hypothetical protein
MQPAAHFFRKKQSNKLIMLVVRADSACCHKSTNAPQVQAKMFPITMVNCSISVDGASENHHRLAPFLLWKVGL